jgi:hypothetical protein
VMSVTNCSTATGALSQTLHVCAPAAGVSFTWTPLTPIVDEAIVFTGTAQGEGPLAYAWAFGDGTTGSGVTATHGYGTAGLYTVTLTVTNACGQDITVQVVEVLAGCEDVGGVDLAFVPPQPHVHETVRFTGTVQAGTGPLTYTWAFDDGGTAQGREVDHAFASIGEHVVTLTVANPCSADIAVTTVHATAWRLFLPLVVHQDDAFEPDNTCQQASVLLLGVDQLHDIDPVADQDWVKFAAAYGNTYEILVLDTGPSLDSFLELFGRDGVTPIDSNPDCSDPQYANCITFAPAAGGDGDYYVRVSDYEWHGGPQDYAYTIRLEVHP